MYNTFKHFSRIAISLGVAVIIVVLGSAGFMIIEENYSFFQAFYMTVITISTVGFREVHELGPSGMIFTSFLIITSIGAFAYAISAVTTYFVAGEYKDIFKTRKLQRSIESLKRSTFSICPRFSRADLGRIGHPQPDWRLCYRGENLGW